MDFKINKKKNYNEKEREENPNKFYDEKKQFNREMREGLNTKDLRCFHNWIKSVLIITYTEKINLNLNFKERISVLEIGCGKGGDLIKWYHSNIGIYIGVDISFESLKQAFGRYQDMKHYKNIFRADFIHQSGSSLNTEFYENIDTNLYFDIVSCQFSMHYMFGDELSARNLFTNITKKLVMDGYFICTIPDSNVIVKRLRAVNENQPGPFQISNKYYSIKINSLNFNKDNFYGLKYGFFLDEAVGTKKIVSDTESELTYVTEYLIEFNNFINLAAEYNLELVEEENFLDYYGKNKEKFKHLFSKIGLKYDNPSKKMDENLWQISNLYKIAVFRKTSGADKDKVFRKYENIEVSNSLIEEKKFN